MDIQAWPFLVSRNQYLDYRTVVAPRFMCEVSVANLLARAAGGKPTQQGHAIYRKIQGSKVGNIALVFRIVEINKKELYSHEQDEILKDPFGREISLIEGIVIKESDDIAVAQEDIEEAHIRLLDYYRKFWEHSDPFQAPIQSLEPFYLRSDNEARYLLTLDEMEPFIVKSKVLALVEKDKLWQVADSFDTKSEISSVAFSPDDTIAIRYNKAVTIPNFGKPNQVIKVWNLIKREVIHSFYGPNITLGGIASSVAFSTDGRLLASDIIERCDQNVIKLWDLKTGEIKHTLSGHKFSTFGRVFAINFSPNGQLIVSASKDKTIKVWNVCTGRVTRTLLGHSQAVRAVSISSDSRVIASADEEGVIKLWNLETGEITKSIDASIFVKSIAFSPNSKFLAIGGDDLQGGEDYIRILNLESKEIYSLYGHQDQVNSVFFNPDCQILATGSKDSEIRLWNIKTGKTVCTLSGHTDEVTSVTFSPDGRTLASGSRDGTFKIWR
jgi:WD40 repeat protein